MATVKSTPLLPEIRGQLKNSQWQPSRKGKKSNTSLRPRPHEDQNTAPKITTADIKFPRIPGKTLLEQWYWEVVVLKQGSQKEKGQIHQEFNRQLMDFTDNFWHKITQQEKAIWKREARTQRGVYSGFDYYRHINMRRGMLDLMPLRTPPNPKKSTPTIVSRETGYPDMPPGKKWKMFLEGETFKE